MAQHHPIYDECLQLSAAAGTRMMAGLAGDARRTLARRDNGRSPDIADAVLLLDRHEPGLCAVLPGLLADAFARGPSQGMADSTDSLTLMDDAQLRESMDAARLRKAVALRLAAALAEMDAMICAARGLDAVRRNDNPLRPEVFLAALRSAVAGTGVPATVQSLWLAPMGEAMSDALLLLYADVAALLKPHMPGLEEARRSGSATQQAAEESQAASVPGSAVPGAVQDATPVSPPSTPAPRPAATAQPPRKKLLLVDDDKAVIAYLSAKLGKHFEIASTTQPASATLIARAEKPDVILCDIDMPGMSGGEVAAALAADPRTAAIPLIYLTALATPEEMADLQGMVSGRPAVSKKAKLAELLGHIQAA